MKLLLFDAGNTLVWLDHAFVVEVLAEHGVRASEDEVLGAEYHAKLLLDELVRSGNGGDDASRGRVYFAEVFRRLGLPEAAFEAAARRLYQRHFEHNLWARVRPGTTDVLRQLKDAGYRLAVISNADGRVEALLEGVGLREYFEFVIDSGVVGIEKPDPRIFQMALERAGVAPADAVYIGDLYEIDVVGARAAGLRAILLDPLGHWTALDCERVAALDELAARLGSPA